MASEAPQLRLYNTLTKAKEDFHPLDENNVRMYVCGPTVYDYAHIGNARPVIVFDVLFRLLRHVYGEEHVTYVRNITDVDDKINARAARDFPDLPLNEAIRKVTEKTAGQFQQDAKALGCLEPTHQPRATENIGEMEAMIVTLLDKKHAYLATGTEGREVLFDVSSMPDYGALSKRNLDEQQAGARIDVKDHKRNPGDFVLWKQSAAGEPGWPATFEGETIVGRPGWHIECSAMSDRYLWDMMRDRLSPEALDHPHQFDIHGGGLDLIFPHHENEIAQSRCAHGTSGMANIWMHNGFLQVEGQKMSKSLGNFITINELLETEKFGGFAWPGETLRLAMLSSHYREPIDFSVRRLEEADIALKHFKTFAFTDADVPTSKSFIDAISDDLNTPLAIAELHRLLKVSKTQAYGLAERATASDTLINNDDPLAAKQLAAGLLMLGIDIDGYDANWLKKSRMVSLGRTAGPQIDEQVIARLEALNAKDFARADAIRADLLEQGIQLMDYKDLETGERRTKWEIKR